MRGVVQGRGQGRSVTPVRLEDNMRVSAQLFNNMSAAMPKPYTLFETHCMLIVREELQVTLAVPPTVSTPTITSHSQLWGDVRQDIHTARPCWLHACFLGSSNHTIDQVINSSRNIAGIQRTSHKLQQSIVISQKGGYIR